MKGVSKSTGHNWRFKDETGKVFGRLTVASFAGHQKTMAKWNCVCECGNSTVVTGSQLRTGRTVSCGCFRAALSRKRFTMHGASRTPEWKIWVGMKQRCYNSACEGYQWYGARGIKICDRWSKFENFLADMGKRPDGLTIERIDKDGDYEPGNCKWDTELVQANNRRNNRHLTVGGVSKTFAQWERQAGLKEGMVSHRIRSGMTPERAVLPL